MMTNLFPLSLFTLLRRCRLAADGLGYARCQQEVVSVDCLFPRRQRSRPDNQEQKRSDSAGSLPGSEPMPSAYQMLWREIHVRIISAKTNHI